MKNTYRVEMMTVKSYGAYMSGSNNYYVKTVEIEAETVAEAIEKAKKENADMVINENYVKKVEKN